MSKGEGREEKKTAVLWLGHQAEPDKLSSGPVCHRHPACLWDTAFLAQQRQPAHSTAPAAHPQHTSAATAALQHRLQLHKPTEIGTHPQKQKHKQADLGAGFSLGTHNSWN